jgi:HAD superfamily hydrolase (TIGR01509 family)
MTNSIARPKGLIFDMDGVLIDSNPWHLKSWLQYAKQLGLELKEEEFPTRVYGKTNEEILRHAFPEESEMQIRAWSDEKEALYRTMFEPEFSLAEGLTDFLAELREKGIPMAVASNAPKANVDFALDLGGIRSFFDVVLFAGLVPRPKPAPDIYIESARLLGFVPEDCAVIEDSPTGLEASVAAGCTSIAITSTFPSDALLPYTSHIVDSFAELQARILF